MLGINRYSPRYEPMSELVSDLFRGFVVRPVGYAGNPAANSETPARFALDVVEVDTAYTVHAELPGFSKQDLRIEIEGDQVIVDTSEVVLGPPRGADTIDQPPQGSYCVATG